MDNSHHSENRSYSEDDIKKLAGLLSVVESNKDAIKELSDELETAAFWYSLALEDKDQDPKIPASKLSPKLASPAKALETSIKQIRQFPRQINGELVTCANELGDKIGHKYGANRLMDALEEVDWIVACLRHLEKKYTDRISDAGGNRRSEPRCRFDFAMRDIMMKFNGGDLQWSNDRINNVGSGALVDFLNICYQPFPRNVMPSSLARTYENHTGT